MEEKIQNEENLKKYAAANFGVKMSIISGKSSMTTTTTTSILKAGSSRERTKNLLNKVRFETPSNRKVMNVLQQVNEENDLVEYEKFLSFIHEGRCDVRKKFFCHFFQLNSYQFFSFLLRRMKNY